MTRKSLRSFTHQPYQSTNDAEILTFLHSSSLISQRVTQLFFHSLHVCFFSRKHINMRHKRWPFLHNHRLYQRFKPKTTNQGKCLPNPQFHQISIPAQAVHHFPDTCDPSPQTYYILSQTPAPQTRPAVTLLGNNDFDNVLLFRFRIIIIIPI